MTVAQLIEMLHAERRSQGKDQTVLSRELGYGSNAVWRWERQLSRMKLNSFVDWANGLGYVVRLEKVK